MSYLVTERKVVASTRNQALSASLAYDAGLRVSERLCLQVKDLD